MTQQELERLDTLLAEITQLIILQIEAQMNLSTAILHIDGIPESARQDAYKAFSGIQEQLDLLNKIKTLGKPDA